MTDESAQNTTPEEPIAAPEAPSGKAQEANQEQLAWKARLRRRRRRTRSGRNRFNREQALQASEPQSPTAAVGVLKSFKTTTFDQSVDCTMHLGIDPRQADQQLRGALSMPHGIGKSTRVVCFCADDKIDDVKSAGAIEAGNDDLAAKIKDGWFDFDVAIASPDMMRVVGQLGKVLGPKGLMPSPKAGTVTPDILTAVKEFAAGKTEYRNDDGGNVHVIIGRMSFSEEQLSENLQHFIDLIDRIRPAAVKGIYVKKCVISGTMTPSVEVEIS